MRRALLTSAAVIALSATGASAQVIGDATLLSIINNVMTDANANFAGIAVNIADIDGSININSTGQGTATGASNIAGDTSTTTTFDNSLAATGFVQTNQASSAVGGISIQTDNPLTDCDVVGGGVGTTALECNTSLASLNITDLETTTTTEAVAGATSATQEATTQNFGAVAALAAGAVNSTTMNLTEEGGAIETGSAANTSNTAASASFSLLSGAGMTGIAYAGNEGFIDGSATILLNGGNIGFTSIGATALGAANTADITATVVGQVAAP
jgi:hypothetical protein